MQDELQKKAQAYEKEQANLPENIKQRREQELQEMYQKIQQSYQDNRQALDKAQGEKLQAINVKVLDAIKAVGQLVVMSISWMFRVACPISAQPFLLM